MAFEPTLLVDGALTILASILFFTVSGSVARRRADGDARTANLAFATWWGSLGLTALLFGVPRALAAFGLLRPEDFVAVVYAGVLPLCAGLAGLLHYLLFVVTGERRWLVPIAGGYMAYFAVGIGYIASLGPVGFATAPWSLSVVYANAAGGWPLWTLLTVLVTPPLAALAPYLRLYARLESATQRYRLVLVSASIVTWFLSIVVASEVGLEQLVAFHPLSRVASLAAALAVYFAYAPPAFVQRRLAATRPTLVTDA